MCVKRKQRQHWNGMCIFYEFPGLKTRSLHFCHCVRLFVCNFAIFENLNLIISSSLSTSSSCGTIQTTVAIVFMHVRCIRNEWSRSNAMHVCMWSLEKNSCRRLGRCAWKHLMAWVRICSSMISPTSANMKKDSREKNKMSDETVSTLFTLYCQRGNLLSVTGFAHIFLTHEFVIVLQHPTLFILFTWPIIAYVEINANWGSDCELWLLCQHPCVQCSLWMNAQASELRTHSNAYPCDEIWFFCRRKCMLEAREWREKNGNKNENYRDRKFDLCANRNGKKNERWKNASSALRIRTHTQRSLFGLDFLFWIVNHCQGMNL